jgi:hypothetical protein
MKKLRMERVSAMDHPGLFRRSSMSRFLPLARNPCNADSITLSVPKATSPKIMRYADAESSSVSTCSTWIISRKIATVLVIFHD